MGRKNVLPRILLLDEVVLLFIQAVDLYFVTLVQYINLLNQMHTSQE